MARIRYTDCVGKVTFLEAETLKQAQRLFKYAVSVATAVYVIELMSDGEVLKRYEVEQ